MAPYIQVKMADKDVIEKVAKLFGVSCQLGDKKIYSYYKQTYKCRIVGPRARGWMMTLFSFMGTRRKNKIKEILCHQ